MVEAVGDSRVPQCLLDATQLMGVGYRTLEVRRAQDAIRKTARQERNACERELYPQIANFLQRKGASSTSFDIGSDIGGASGLHPESTHYLATPPVEITGTDGQKYRVVVAEDEAGYSIRLKMVGRKDRLWPDGKPIFQISWDGEATPKKVEQVSAILDYLGRVLPDQAKDQPAVAIINTPFFPDEL